MENQKQPLWTRDSSILLGGFFVTIFLIVYIWWPLAEEVLSYIDWNGPWWLYMDWLLLGVFMFMSITIVACANLKTDLLIVFAGVCGGLATMYANVSPEQRSKGIPELQKNNIPLHKPVRPIPMIT